MLITDEVLRAIEDCIELAPLHNPANIQGIVVARTALGVALPQVAVFDTAFHQTLPEHAFIYALPYQLYRRHRIRNLKQSLPRLEAITCRKSIMIGDF